MASFLSYLQALPERIAFWSKKKIMLASFLAGMLCFPAMPPWNFWPGLVAGLTLAFLLLSQTISTKRAAVMGWFFGIGYFGPGLIWIGNALLVDGNPFSWVWPLAIAGLPALLAFFPAASFSLLAFCGCLPTITGYFLFAAALSAAEWLRGHLFTGFPWNLFAYTWSDTASIAQLSSVTGAYGLTFITILWLSLPGFLWIANIPWQRKTTIVFCVLASFCVAFLWGQARLAANPTDMRSDLIIKIVQPNISQADKWNPDKAGQNLKKIFELSRNNVSNDLASTVIIWPETALSDRALQIPAVSDALKAILASYTRQVFLLSGVLRRDPDQSKYYNSLIAYDRDLSVLQTYDKSHLVPFGEYIPFQDVIPLKPFVKFSGFEKGQGIETQNIHDLLSYSPLVCYEIIFPGSVSLRSKRPNLLVNVTNDAWYGDSAGPHQHFAKAQFRAIEEGIPVARSANTGISGMIDPYGRIIAYTGLFLTDSVDVALPKVADKPTFYSLYGDIPLVCILFVIFVFAGRRAYHNRYARSLVAGSP